MTRTAPIDRVRNWANGKGLLLSAAALFLLLCAAYSFSIDIRATRVASITGYGPRLPAFIRNEVMAPAIGLFKGKG